MILWISIALLTLLIGALAFYPLLSKKRVQHDTARDSLNKAFYFDRLREVEQETAEGVIDDPEQSKQELQRSLLDDIPATEKTAAAGGSTLGKGWFVALIALIGAVASGVYVSVGSWKEASELRTSHNNIDYFFARLRSESSEPLSDSELNRFAVALRAELQKNPQDHASWFMLGRLGMALDNGQLAFESFSKAAELQPENTEYKLNLAQMLLYSNDPTDKENGERLLKDVIRQDHTNIDALNMLAFRSFEQEDYKMAAMTWGMMLKLLPEDNPRRDTIERSINSALAMLKEQEQKNGAAKDENKGTDGTQNEQTESK